MYPQCQLVLSVTPSLTWGTLSLYDVSCQSVAPLELLHADYCYKHKAMFDRLVQRLLPIQYTRVTTVVALTNRDSWALTVVALTNRNSHCN